MKKKCLPLCQSNYQPKMNERIVEFNKIQNCTPNLQEVDYAGHINWVEKGRISHDSHTIDQPLYFQPVDNKWRKEKCEKLGFEFIESEICRNDSARQEITPRTLPYHLRVFEDDYSMYRSLSYILCGTEIHYYDLRHKKIIPVRF